MKIHLLVVPLLGLLPVRAQAQNAHFVRITLPDGPTTWASVANASAPVTPPPTTYSDAQGLKITPLTSEPDDLADILGVRLWYFQVEMPQLGLRLHYTLEVRQQGENGQFKGVLDQLNSTTTDPINVDSPTSKNDYRNVQVLVGFYKDKEEEIWNSFSWRHLSGHAL